MGEDGEAQPQLQNMEPFRGFAILNENESQSAPNELTEATKDACKANATWTEHLAPRSEVSHT